MRTTTVALMAMAGSVAATEYEYKVSPIAMTYPVARNWCGEGSGFRGQLTSITSKSEWDLIHSLVKDGNSRSDYWIGLTRVSGNTWVYEDGQSVVESFGGNSVWKTGEPNNFKRREHCVAVGRNNQQWNDANCDGNRKQLAVCKREAVANPYTHAGYSNFHSSGSSSTCYYKYFNRVMNQKVSQYSRRTWFDAEGFCNEELTGGAHLVSIESEEESDFVKNLVYVENNEFENRPIWIGGRKTNGQWAWSDSSGFTFTNWLPNEPNEEPDFKFQAVKHEQCVQFSHARVGDGFARTERGNQKRKIGDVGQWNNADCLKTRGWICEFCSDDF